MEIFPLDGHNTSSPVRREGRKLYFVLMNARLRRFSKSPILNVHSDGEVDMCRRWKKCKHCVFCPENRANGAINFNVKAFKDKLRVDDNVERKRRMISIFLGKVGRP